MTKPFLKWPGGKRWLSPNIIELLKNINYERYIEPFLGGGAVFFGLQPQKAIISDLNKELIVTYRMVRDRPNDIIMALKKIPVKKAIYNNIRERMPENEFDKAVRFIYLNRTAFGGIYRINREGKFNVPFGGGQRTPEALWEKGILFNAAQALKMAKIICCDFEKVMDKVGKKDVIYCDPAYVLNKNNGEFRRYNKNLFSWDDQIRLSKIVKKAVKKGASVIVSNAMHPEIDMLYSGAQKAIFKRKALINPDPVKRNQIHEVLYFYIQ